MKGYSYSTRSARLAMAFAMGLAMGASGISGALAAPPPSQDGVQHFMTCLGLMMTNGPQHAVQCGPNPYVPTEQLAPTMGGGPNCTTHPVALIDAPFVGLEVASLGDGSEYLPQLRQRELVARALLTCCSALRAPLAGDVMVASLGDFGGLIPSTGGSSRLLAYFDPCGPR